MVKKLLKLVTVFTLILGCYQAYVRAFEGLVQALTTARKVDDIGFIVQKSRTQQEAVRRALESFGPDHWTAREDLQLRYYNADRELWMYAQDFERIIEEDGVHYDGRRIKLRPVAIILKDKNGSTRTVTAEEAVIDFNQPLIINPKPDAEPLVVKYARLERNVVIRDDRGTVGDRRDDMVIGPLTWVEYDDNSLQVRSEARVLIVDRDTNITGDGMLIKLRPKGEGVPNAARSAGFEGAQSARLLRNVEITFSDVGKTGVLPGSATVKQQGPDRLVATTRVAPAASGAKDASGQKAAAEPVPLNLRCDGPMQVDFPKPALPVKVGPPEPSAPTLVHFERNVVVRRGKLSEMPDQLDTDNLDLVLLPAEKPAPGPGQSGSKGSAEQASVGSAQTQGEDEELSADEDEPKKALGNLTVQRVKATGHAVWLQLPSQGAKIRCNELRHTVGPPGGESLTYFRGDASRKLWVEKHDYVEEPSADKDKPAIRKLQSITRVWTIDATLVDNGSGMESANLFAHGPGLLETRPAPKPTDPPGKEIPPDRTVAWQDVLVVKNVLGSDKQVVSRELILKGNPRVVDRIKQASLDAADTIVVWLKPKPKEAGDASTTTTAPAAPGTRPQDQNFQIERLLALRDVRLIAPSRELYPRDRLDVDFEEQAQPATVVASNMTSPAATTPGSAAAAPAPAGATAAADPQAPAKPKEEEVEPLMVARAHHVKAKVVIDSSGSARETSQSSEDPGRLKADGSSSNYQVRDLTMFGGVTLHQDPAAGKTKGQDATGETLVLQNDGPGRAVFNLYNHDPRAKKEAGAPAAKRPPARVVTEDMTVEGDWIGVNQRTDQAWVYGPGKLVQMTERSLLTDKAEESETGEMEGIVKQGEGTVRQRDANGKPKAAAKRTRAGKALSDKVPLVITWAEKMVFSGISRDPENRPVAKAQFFKNARAEIEDGLLYCDKVMTTYTDRPIPLAEVGKLRQSAAAGKEDAAAEATEAEQPKPDLALIHLEGNAQVINRKVDPDRPIVLSRQRLTGEKVIYDRRTGDFQIPGAGTVYLYDRENQSTAAAGPGQLAGQRTIRPAADRPEDRNKKKIPDLVLTQIRFKREMKGRVGTGKANDRTTTRWADFFGDIESARAVVPNEQTVLDYDRLPPKSYFLTSQTMRVVMEPPPVGSTPDAPSRNYLKAWENAYARTEDMAIQADVITYDSSKDLIYANGEEGRHVQIVQQKGIGQPASPTRAQSLRVNPRTGAVNLSDPRELQLVDSKTGTRPKPQAPPNPNAKLPKKPKGMYRTQPNNIERKGFSGG